MSNAGEPTNVAEEDSETPWLTTQAIEFFKNRDPNERFLCPLSYIKPHWSYFVPAPYNDMYGPNSIQPVICADEERIMHPVYAWFMANKIGRLMDYLENSGRMQNTMIILA